MDCIRDASNGGVYLQKRLSTCLSNINKAQGWRDERGRLTLMHTGERILKAPWEQRHYSSGFYWRVIREPKGFPISVDTFNLFSFFFFLSNPMIIYFCCLWWQSFCQNEDDDFRDFRECPFYIWCTLHVCGCSRSKRNESGLAPVL